MLTTTAAASDTALPTHFGIPMRSMILPVLAALLPIFALIGAEPSPLINGIVGQVHFSPRGGCADAIIAELEAAKASVYVQAYSFTHKGIAKALVEAARRGVKVSVILDKSQRTEKYSGADFVANAGIPVVIDEKPAIAHSKVMIIDTNTVITGSYNFTTSAEERNVENLLVLRSAELAMSYRAVWKERQEVSVPFVPRSER
jgi:phosphatidylserine/phosphatidylglycerophosphate/cardiolipin synthase-like enzyme